MNNKYDYRKTLKTKPDDTFLNIQSYLYVTSGQITKFLFNTRVIPHQIIFLSMVFGIASSYLIVQSEIALVILGAVLLFYKNVLDKVDGSLARARGTASRRGRFYDSISDFIVNIAVFTAISCSLFKKYHDPIVFAVGYAAMISSMLQCSFFIYYQVSFIKATGMETVNRLIESVTEEDKKSADGWTLFLQRIFQIIYGWQDQLILYVDNFMKKLLRKGDSQFTIHNSKFDELWFKYKGFLTLASSLSIGTHMLLIAVFAIFKSFEAYLFVNLILMNLLLICLIIYKYFSVRKALATNSKN